MTDRCSPAVITALSEKADMVREVASALGFPFSEEVLNDGAYVRFRFELTEGDTVKLAASVPREAFAYRAIFDKPLERES